MELARPGADINITQVVNDQAEGAEPSVGNLMSTSELVKNLKLAGITNIGSPESINLSEESKCDIEEKFQLPPNAKYKVIQIMCQTPNFEAGSLQPLSFAKKVQEKKQGSLSVMESESKKASNDEKNAVWSLADLDDDDVELLDPDTLIDEEDIKKPEAGSLRGN